MVKISDLISKYVVSLYNGCNEGVIENVLFNPATLRVKFFVVYNPFQETTSLLSYDKIYSIGQEAVSIKNSSHLNLKESMELELEELYNPINSTAFNLKGNLLGIVKDVIIDDKFYIKKLQLNNNTELEHKRIGSFNNQTTIIYEKDEKVNIKNFFERKKVFAPTTDTRIVNILEIKNENGSDQKIFGLQENHKANTTMLVPNKAITNYNFLINRKVQKNILSQTGDLIIKQNTKINTNTINVARLNGKLKELTKYSN